MIVLGEDYEHVQGLSSDQCGGITYEARRLGDLYKLILAHGHFDVSEFSLSNHAMFRDRGEMWLTAIPVFPSRSFRHGTLVVRHDSTLNDFRQLAGKKVGISDYSMTAAVWIRGLMLDDYDVHWSTITWVSGTTPRFPPPDGVKFLQTDKNLEDLLAAGEIDALMAPNAKDSKQPLAQRRFRPLVSDVTQIEKEYFRRTGIFPIMHTVVLREHVTKSFPDAPRILYDLYTSAKHRALDRRLATTFMPWLNSEWDSILDLMGGDPNPYGLTDINRGTIETLARYLLEQKLVKSRIEIDSLFVEGCSSWLAG